MWRNREGRKHEDVSQKGSTLADEASRWHFLWLGVVEVGFYLPPGWSGCFWGQGKLLDKEDGVDRRKPSWSGTPRGWPGLGGIGRDDVATRVVGVRPRLKGVEVERKASATRKVWVG